MFFETLNSVVEYIENHLKDDIDINVLAQILNTNQDTFKRIFTLICGISVTEYIKRRRLTVCCADLKNFSVLDVAYMYGYSSGAGFSRAFYEFYKCYPSDVKKNAEVKLNAFLPIKISTNLGLSEINYSIENWGKMELWGYFVQSKVNSIPEIIGREYERFLAKYEVDEYYGITFYEANGEAKFWLCSVDMRDDLSVISVPAGKWLVLDYRGSYSEISNFVKTIYRDIGKQINCSLAHKIDMERYSNGGVKLCFLLK